ncbi:VOC family protein [Rhodococcus sp. 14C212]|uniref:VOC family protein n=1 Tax=Rhodococcus sp. 14C212 TaxID=2711209 RepID=UPI0013ECD180|nr:VOC family protein [Rhodococcus sp. 14C212]NGP05833.1 VOC family protein [Rhodococcus sp. 14C212]
MPNTQFPMADLFHVGVVVEDIHEAIAAYSATGATFTEVRDITLEVVLDGVRRTEHMFAAYTKQGPPYLELIQELEGNIWGSDALDLNHLGYWAEDVDATAKTLEQAGFTLRMMPPASPPRIAYLSGPGSIWVELCGPGVRTMLAEWLTTSYAGPDSLPVRPPALPTRS